MMSSRVHHAPPRGAPAAPRSGVTNAAAVEAILAGHGHTLLHPETLDLPRQRARLTAAKLLTGENRAARHRSPCARATRLGPPPGRSLARQRGTWARRGQRHQVPRDPWTGWAPGRSQCLSARLVRRALQSR